MPKNLLYTRQNLCSKSFINQCHQLKTNVWQIPTIATIPIDYSLKMKKTYQWVFFTSANAVNYFDFSRLTGTEKIAVIGIKTQQALTSLGYSIDFLPSKAVSEVFVKEWQLANPETQQILLPNSALSRPIIKQKLEEFGHEVFEIAIYTTIFPAPSKVRLSQLLTNETLDYLIFASPSAWHYFYEVAQNYLSSWQKAKLFSIGPVTTKAIQNTGKFAIIQAEEYHMESVYQSILKELIKNGKTI